MGMNKKRWVLILSICLLLIVSIVTVIKLTERKDKRIDTEFFSIEIPKDWNLEVGLSGAAQLVNNNGENVGGIQPVYHVEYPTTLESVITNYCGMDSYLKETYSQVKKETYSIYHVLVGYTPEVVPSNDELKDELYYFYCGQDNYVIFQIAEQFVSNKSSTIDTIALSLKIKE